MIRGLRWILANRRQPNGRAMSMRALSLAAGLSASHVEQIVNKRQSPDVEIDTLEALARAGNVSTLWLHKGIEPREPYQGPAVEAPATPAPPASETRVTLDAVADLVNSAYDPATHLPSDAMLVGEALQIAATFRRAHVDPAAYVRRLLDAAAKERQRGRKVAPADLPTIALRVLGEQLDERDERVRRLQEELARAYDWMRERNIPLPEDMAALAQRKASTDPPRRPGSGQHAR